MIGEIDSADRALVRLRMQADKSTAPAEVVAWVDTAFDGELVMPRSTIEQLGLAQSSAVNATLADGTSTILETFQCVIDWLGIQRRVEVIANEGRFPLLGIGLLRGTRLTVDYRTSELTIE